MPSRRYTTPKLKVQIPTYLPLAEAARKYNLSEKVLTQMIQTGKIKAVQLPTGELLVASEDNEQKPKTKEEVVSEKFADLRGVPISPYSAQKKYGGIHRNNFIKWARSGYIEILVEDDRLIELNEADVAYCAQIYFQKKEEYGGKIAGARVFDETGNPYQLKYPDLSAKRRE